MRTKRDCSKKHCKKENCKKQTIDKIRVKSAKAAIEMHWDGWLYIHMYIYTHLHKIRYRITKQRYERK